MRMYIGMYRSEDHELCFNFIMWPEDKNRLRPGVEWLVGRIYFGEFRFFVARCYETTRIDEEARQAMQRGWGGRLEHGT